MSETIMSVHFTDEAPAAGQSVVQVHADNLPAAGEPYVLPAATADAIGGVRVAAFGEAIGRIEQIDAAAADLAAVAAALNEVVSELDRLVSGLEKAGALTRPGA